VGTIIKKLIFNKLKHVILIYSVDLI